VASESEFADSFGRALKLVRAERSLSRRDLAEAAGLSYAYVSDIESGRKQPSTRALLALSEALLLKPHELMARAARFEPEGYFDMRRAVENRVPLEAFSQEAAESRLPEPSDIFQSIRPHSRAGGEGPFGTLIALARRLPEDDLELLIMLARRFRQQQKT
jgi:transcriptional regulator with XRE-family HTH domain